MPPWSSMGALDVASTHNLQESINFCFLLLALSVGTLALSKYRHTKHGSDASCSGRLVTCSGVLRCPRWRQCPLRWTFIINFLGKLPGADGFRTSPLLQAAG